MRHDIAMDDLFLTLDKAEQLSALEFMERLLKDAKEKKSPSSEKNDIINEKV